MTILNLPLFNCSLANSSKPDEYSPSPDSSSEHVVLVLDVEASELLSSSDEGGGGLSACFFFDFSFGLVSTFCSCAALAALLVTFLFSSGLVDVVVVDFLSLLQATASVAAAADEGV